VASFHPDAYSRQDCRADFPVDLRLLVSASPVSLEAPASPSAAEHWPDAFSAFPAELPVVLGAA
jgi:hypothetical protein